jgi:hypothetical protein
MAAAMLAVYDVLPLHRRPTAYPMIGRVVHLLTEQALERAVDVN